MIARVLVVTLLVLGAGCTGRPRAFPPETARLRRVAVVPPQVNFARRTLTGPAEPLPAERATAAVASASAAETALRARGFEVRPATLADADLRPDDPLRYELDRARERNAEFLARVRTETPLRSLGPEVGALADRAGVDALVFVQVVGTSSSAGKAARDVAATILSFGMTGSDVTQLRAAVTLVHGTTGQVLWWGWKHASVPLDGPGVPALVAEVVALMPSLPAAS